MKNNMSMFLFALFTLVLTNKLTADTIKAFTVDVASDVLYSLDLASGTATPIGDTGFPAVRGLSFDPTTSILYGIDQTTDELITIDTKTGAGKAVGALGVDGIGGLAFNSSGDLFYVYEVDQTLYSVNKSTGAATAIGSTGVSITGLSFSSDGTLYGFADIPDNSLYAVDPTDGSSTLIGPLGFEFVDGGIDFDEFGSLWGVFDNGDFGTFDVSTGALTIHGNHGIAMSGLAIMRIPEPVCPSDATLIEGSGEINDYSATCGSDDIYWAAHGATLFFQISDPVVQFELTATAPTGFEGDTISARIEASTQNENGNLALTARMYDFTAGQYVALPGVLGLTTADQRQNFALPGSSDPADFIEGGTDEVRLLIQIFQISGLPNTRTQLDEVLFNFE